MAKFSNSTTKVPATRGPSSVKEETRTYNGAKGYTLDDKSALFFLAAVNMVGEDTYYEAAALRDERFKQLVHSVTRQDPEWVQRFIPYLRNEMNMRSASIVAAAEYVQAGGPNARQVVSSAMSRADEPAEFLAYWMQNYYGWDGKSYPLPAPKLPQAVRKGVADAAIRLYNERSALKYNGLSRGVSMGNVLNLVHPKAKNEVQNALFKYIVDRHHGNDVSLETLRTVSEFNRLNALPQDQRRAVLADPVQLHRAGFTWESLSGWLGGPMDAQAWEAMIEAGMGYMALLRNLRNFDEAKIAKSYRDKVIAKLVDPAEVAASRQFPFRFFSAYKSVNSVHWLGAIEEALDLSCQNIPQFDGDTLVCVDLSGSMTAALSAKSTVQRLEVGAVFGAALALAQNSGEVTLVGFGDSNKRIEIPRGASVLRIAEKVARTNVGHSTNLMPAINDHYDRHSRVVVFSDMQCNPGRLKSDVKVVHSFDLGGYNRTPFKVGSKGQYQYGGFSDKTFTLMKNLEVHQSGNWPF